MTNTIVFTAPEKAELLELAPDGRPLAADEVAGPTLFTLLSLGTELSTVFSWNG